MKIIKFMENLQWLNIQVVLKKKLHLCEKYNSVMECNLIQGINLLSLIPFKELLQLCVRRMGLDFFLILKSLV